MAVRIEILIGKGDQDIKEWLDLIEEKGQSRALWCSALLYAFKNGLKLDTGFGCTSTNAAADKTYEERKHLYPQAKQKKGQRGYMATLSNPEIIEVYKDLIAEDYYISRVLKEMIRRGESSYPPDIKNAKRVLLGEDGMLKRPGKGGKKTPVRMPKKDEDLKKPKNPLLEFI